MLFRSAAHVTVGSLGSALLTLDQVLAELPLVTVTAEQAMRVLHGAPIGVPHNLPSTSAPIRVKDEQGRLLAIGTYDGQGRGTIKIDKVLVDGESLN